ncbi:MAG: hypothetical protein WAM75_18430, partial [Xanthobacteraceae bacterium]
MSTLVLERDESAAAAPRGENDPVTLHRTMQAMIGDGLRERYQAPQKLSHELFVVLMQLNEEDRRRSAAKPSSAKPSPAKRSSRS